MSKKLGELIKEARNKKGLSQAALAEAVDGITSSQISKIERGENEPDQSVIKQIAKTLGVTQKSLLEAATGASKTSSKSTSKKTTSKKTSTSKKKTSSTASDLKLTAAEKKLVQAYRKADSDTKKAALKLLTGDVNPMELIGVYLAGKSKEESNDKTSDAGGLLASLLSGKTGNSSAKEENALGSILEALGQMNK